MHFPLQEALHDELNEARAAYARKSTAGTQMIKHQSSEMDEEEETDLAPMLKVRQSEPLRGE